MFLHHRGTLQVHCYRLLPCITPDCHKNFIACPASLECGSLLPLSRGDVTEVFRKTTGFSSLTLQALPGPQRATLACRDVRAGAALARPAPSPQIDLRASPPRAWPPARPPASSEK